MAFEIGGVDDVDDEVGVALHQIGAGHVLIGAAAAKQTVDAGQVDDLELLALEQGGARPVLDGHARPVADLLAGAGQEVEQGRLAAIGIAGKGDDGKAGHGVRFRGLGVAVAHWAASWLRLPASGTTMT